MSKNVCMFVWNHFTNDARVLRECSALVEAGYKVDLIAIHDWKQPELKKQELRSEGFTVIRVNNQMPLLSMVSAAIEKVKQNILVQLILIALIVLSIVYVPIVVIGIVLLAMLVLPRKLRTMYLRSYIALQMIKWGIKKEYHIYHSNDLNTLPQGFICARVLRRRKFIYDSHEVQTSRTGYNSKWYGVAEKFFVKHIDVMIMENHTRADYINQLYGFYPHVVHNYPMPMKPEQSQKIDIHKILDIPKKEPILLYQGGIQIGRGLDKLIQAVPMFQRGVVVLIGDGRMKPELIKMVRELGVEDRVKFLPKVPVEELLHYTKNAYLGFQILNNVCFNHYSASSNKLFEYIMSTVPVVACSFPEIQGVVESEHVGVCVDSHNPVSIAEGVNYLLNNSEEYLVMKDKCFHAREKYSWYDEKKILLDIYDQVAS